MQKLANFVGGVDTPPVSGQYFDTLNPATGETITLVPDSDERDIELAVTAAEKAFECWSSRSAEERCRVMLKVADLIEQNLEKFAQVETRDSGKPITRSREIEIPRAIQNFRFFATAIVHYASETHQTSEHFLNYTLRSPVGITGCISPWNLPLYLFTWKIAPALAAGNCVIGKPSELTPITAFLLGEICNDAGLPAGVLNIVHGYGNKVGSAISSHPKIPLISFTGGTKTGAEISRVAAPMFKKLSLELGGKNPVLVFDDCNYDEMLETTVRSSFANSGQICLCGSRILVDTKIYHRFRDDYVERVKALKIGDPSEPTTDMGAVISQTHFDKILSYIELAKSEGGTVLTGGKPLIGEGICKNGWFIEPTVIEGLSANCRTNQEEIFGPVVTLTPFENEEQALELANGTQYGLASVVWTNDLSRAHHIAQRIQSGIVWVNCWMVRDLRTPFGGVKDSGVGREGGWEALRFFTSAKNVGIQF